MPINIQEMVVSLGAKVDNKSMSDLMKALDMGKLKAAALGGAMVAAGKLIYNFVRDATAAEQSLVKLARQQHQSVAAARAQQNALKAMGKTMQEVNKDPALKQIYQDILKINRTVPAPDMRTALADIHQLQSAFMGFKSMVQYALQWVNYHILRNLEQPIRRITDLLRRLRDGLNKNMNGLAAKIASYISAFARGLMGIVELGIQIVEWVHKLPDGIKAIGTAALAVFAFLKSGPLGQIMMLVTAIGGLIQDYENFKWNKANADKEQIPIAFPSIWELLEDSSTDGAEKAIAIGSLIGEKISGAISNIAIDLSSWISTHHDDIVAFGASLGEVIGPAIAAVIKLGGAIIEEFIALAVDPEFWQACWELALTVGRALKEALDGIFEKILPEWALELLGIETETQKATKQSIQEQGGYDENGRFVSPWEIRNLSEEQQSKIRGAENEREMRWLMSYDTATKASGLELKQAPGDLYPSMVAPKNLSAANNEYVSRFSDMWQEAITKKNGAMLEDLAKAGAAFQQEYNAAPDGAFGIRSPEEMQTEKLFAEKLQAIQEKEYPITIIPETDDGRMLQLSTSVHDYINDHMRNNPIDIATRVLLPTEAAQPPLGPVRKHSSGGRIGAPITTEVAEDGAPEYIIPIKKEGRAFPLIAQMLREMGSSAIQRVMADLGMDGGADTVGGSLGSLGSPGLGSVTINNTYTISAPCNITVNASGADAREIGTTAYNAAQRHLIRTVQSVFA